MIHKTIMYIKYNRVQTKGLEMGKAIKIDIFIYKLSLDNNNNVIK